MARYAHVPEPTPMGSINVTPFIDVMLVLLIVMILSIPPMTHKVPINTNPGEFVPTDIPNVHLLTIDRAGEISWDGRLLSQAALPAVLAKMQRDPAAELHLKTDPESRYERFDQVLAAIKRAGVTRLTFIDNEKMVDF